MLANLMSTLQSLVDQNCPDNRGVYVTDLDNKQTWGFHPGPNATQQQIDAANSAIQSLDLTPFQQEISDYKAQMAMMKGGQQ